jgi:CxxC motif-containing protein (DUF1111 family)
VLHPRKPRWIALLGVPVILLALTGGCANTSRHGGLPHGEIASGGDGTVIAEGKGAYSQPARNLDDHDIARFRVGDTFFTMPWDPAPGRSPERDGLGPTFLATSCAGCHPADGVGDAPGTVDSDGSPILRFTDQMGLAAYPPAYGYQIQTQSVAGVPGEATFTVTWIESAGEYDDGTSFSLRSPVVDVHWGVFGQPGGVTVSGLVVAPKLIGLGLLEAIPVPDIVAGADPDDEDGDGISGRVSWVDTPSGPVPGRFGRKATVSTVADQVSMAYVLDLGITSPTSPSENCPTPQVECAAAPSGGAPEIAGDRFDDVVLYSQTLAVPARVSAEDASVIEGEAIFTTLGCSVCHVATWDTRTHVVPALADQTIHPYTDLLLHDMGQGLSDGRSVGDAGPTEWRTAPLWGLGSTHAVNPRAGFLHDGRARTIEEAVLWHGGEAQQSRDAFTSLSASDRQRVVAFLKSL